MRVLITGGTGGIGRATVDLLAAHGHQVLLMGRTQPASGPWEFFKADLADYEAVGRAFAKVAEGGALDGVVASAGMGAAAMGDAPLDKVQPSSWQALLRANLDTMYHTLHFAIPLLREAAPSSVVTVSSIAGMVGSPGGVGTHTYAASKGAVIQLTRAAAITYAPDHIRFNVICPGAVDTPLLRKFFDTYPHVEEQVISRHPLGRVAYPEDIAELAAFLLSPASAFITGAVIPVDGGFTAA